MGAEPAGSCKFSVFQHVHLRFERVVRRACGVLFVCHQHQPAVFIAAARGGERSRGLKTVISWEPANIRYEVTGRADGSRTPTALAASGSPTTA